MGSLPEKYRTKRVKIDIEGIDFKLDLVTNTDELLDQLVDKGPDHEDFIDEKIPYWADLWPSAIALGSYLIRKDIIRKGIRVTEIGCGLGLAGIVAGKLGAVVTMTDYIEEALLFAQHNWSLNLDTDCQTEQMDWRYPKPELAADLLLAADLAYNERLAKTLPLAFRQLCRPGGKILISEPNRSFSKAFFEALPDHGFSVKKEEITGAYEGVPYRVGVYELKFQP